MMMISFSVQYKFVFSQFFGNKYQNEMLKAKKKNQRSPDNMEPKKIIGKKIFNLSMLLDRSASITRCGRGHCRLIMIIRTDDDDRQTHLCVFDVITVPLKFFFFSSSSSPHPSLFFQKKIYIENKRNKKTKNRN